MDRWKGRIALVTGAASGIGAEVSRELVKHEMIVIGCDKNFEGLEKLAKEEVIQKASGHFEPVKCDLSHESEIMAMFQKIREEHGRIDVCINNAGISKHCPLAKADTEKWRLMLDVNVLAVCICTRESINLMRESNTDDGQIINISCMSGHTVKSVSFYSGTKFMVCALTEGLRKELHAAGSHIRVACISPGLVETGFLCNMLESCTRAMELYESMECLQTEDIAQAVLYILSMEPRVNVNDILIRPVEQMS